MKKKILYATKALAIAYIAIIAYMFFFQRTLLYHPDKDMRLPSYYGLDMQAIALLAEDKTEITAWYKEKKGKPYIVYFHGNAGNLGLRSEDLKAFINEEFGVLAISYRGFGTSSGSPTEEGLYQDARAAITFLKKSGVAEKDMVLYGESLGTGIATKMATEINARALILEAPYTSIAKRAREIYPFIPVELLVEDNFESIEKIKTVRIPVLIMHGEIDNVMPVHHGKAVYAAANEPRKIIFFSNNGHNNKNVEEIAKLVKEFISLYD